MKWFVLPLLCALGWYQYDLSLSKEQNKNLALLVLDLEDESRICGKALRAEKEKPITCDRLLCPEQAPCFEVVYTGNECEPCRCGEDD